MDRGLERGLERGVERRRERRRERRIERRIGRALNRALDKALDGLLGTEECFLRAPVAGFFFQHLLDASCHDDTILNMLYEGHETCMFGGLIS